MKVYVVIGSYDYEGYREPVGVFDTFEAAKIARDVMANAKRYDGIDIYEYDMNVADSGFLV